MLKIEAAKTFEEVEKRLGLEEGGRVQQVVDAAALRYLDPYTPMRTGALAANPYAHTVVGSGEINYAGPSARYLYYGEVYGPNIPIFEEGDGEPTGWFSPPGKEKYPTGRKLRYSTEKHALACAFWFEVMKGAHTDDILKEARNAAATA